MSKLLSALKCCCSSINSVRLCKSVIIENTAKINLWNPAPVVENELELGFKRLTRSNSNSLLKKYLTEDLFERLKSRRTSFNSTLLDCVQSGFTNSDSVIGVYAPDEAAYTVFADLFDPIIEEIHGFARYKKHPTKYFGNLQNFTNMDPCNAYVIFTRIEARRCLRGFPFSPALQIHEFNEIEDIVATLLCQLPREFQGRYYPLSCTENEYVRYLKSYGYLFDEKNKYLRAAHGLKGWPVGRGVFISDRKDLVVWVNEEDHIRLFSQQLGGNIQSVYCNLIKATNMINIRVKFATHNRLGFLTACPSNLGTTIRASVHIKLPKLSKDKAKFEEVAAKFNLQIRGSAGEHSEAVGGIYDISNKQRIGLTEYQAVKTMQDGILEMIKIEQSL